MPHSAQTETGMYRMTSILVSRFMLDLQRANRNATAGYGFTSSLFQESLQSSVVFDRVVGSIGSLLSLEDVVAEEEDTTPSSADPVRDEDVRLG